MFAQEPSVVLLLLLVCPSPTQVMASSLLDMTAWSPGNSSPTAKDCLQVETRAGGLTVHCSGLRLMKVPLGLSNQTVCLFLNKNLLSSLPPNSFSTLLQLHELDLSNNQLSTLEPGCFYGLANSLRLLDLSSNRLSTLDPEVFGGLQVQVNFTHNPWHCDCSMQMSVSLMDLEASSVERVVCQTSDIPNAGTVGLPLVLLVEDWDLCQSVRRTTDVLTLVTMFLWFFMLISYLIYYIRQNEVFANQHFEYIKFLENREPFSPIEFLKNL
ncbi:leucine-rich repeat-containing protein 3-like [Oryzias latipes]|uniref:leucine-rich repeat-containing protein 3-like n=1 Tax=Oryzias latipes TaxID=8090 RepID=UPI0002A48B01|nr:leucine-rich repeat-containing protein 3-like [Oryzias latipes]